MPAQSLRRTVWMLAIAAAVAALAVDVGLDGFALRVDAAELQVARDTLPRVDADSHDLGFGALLHAPSFGSPKKRRPFHFVFVIAFATADSDV